VGVDLFGSGAEILVLSLLHWLDRPTGADGTVEGAGEVLRVWGRLVGGKYRRVGCGRKGVSILDKQKVSMLVSDIPAAKGLS
jgi:hypothetical protein